VKETKPTGLQRIWRALGPGVITGAADDDPSGIATYSITGAQFGNQFTWAALLTWPLMGCVQMMSARIGMVSGEGLAGAFRRKFPMWMISLFTVALLIANTINIASDLAAMGDAVEMLGGGPGLLWVALFGVGICIAAVHLRYRQLALVLQWLAIALFAYVITAFMVKVDWGDVARSTFVPALPRGSEAWATLVAILGTTISPFLFYWQAGQEIEEQKAKGRRLRTQRLGASKRAIVDRRLDVAIGTLFSNLIMFFIIVTTAATLHASGHVKIETTRQAAEALKPLAGNLSYWLFSAGLIGTGLLAIPTLAGSAAYAFAETFDWAYGLDQRFKRAPSFYAVFIFATLAAVAIDFVGVNPIKALFWSAVVNGLLAPPVLVCMYLVANDRKIMVGQPSPRIVNIGVALTAVLMTAAAVCMFIF
jgi:NRAMP (natural resistance-associated macrophage protein)-like metal ion transporter